MSKTTANLIPIQQPDYRNHGKFQFITGTTGGGAEACQHMTRAEYAEACEKRVGPGRLVEIDGVFFWECKQVRVVDTFIIDPATDARGIVKNMTETERLVEVLRKHPDGWKIMKHMVVAALYRMAEQRRTTELEEITSDALRCERASRRKDEE